MNHLSPFYKEKFENEKLLLLKEKELGEELNQLLANGSWLGSFLESPSSKRQAKTETQEPNLFQNGIQIFQNIQEIISQVKEFVKQFQSSK